MSTGHALDERLHAAALEAAIKAHLGPWEVYEYGQVPGLDGNAGEQPPMYVLLQVERRHLPPTHGSRRPLRTGWRVSVRGVGTTADECRWVLLRITRALDGVRLAIGGRQSTPLEHEPGNAPEPGNTRVEALLRFTYAV